MSSEQASPHIKGYRGVDAMTALGGKTNEQCQQASGVEEIEKLIETIAATFTDESGAIVEHPAKAKLIATVRQLAGDCEMHSGIALSALAKATELQAERDAAREELAKANELLSQSRANVDGHEIIRKRICDLHGYSGYDALAGVERMKAELAQLRASAGEGLEGLLETFRNTVADYQHAVESGQNGNIKACADAMDAIRALFNQQRQRIKELSLFTPVTDEELERAMASYGRTVEAVVIRKAVRALEQRIKELEEAAEEANDRWREMGIKGDG